MTRPLHIVILAAGQGKRMNSDKAKVLHSIAGKPMIAHVVDTAQKLAPKAIHVIVGHKAEDVQTALQAIPVNFVLQKEQLGTGHAVLQALPQIDEEADVLILSGDVPLIRQETLETLLHCSQKGADLSLLVAKVDNPHGLGRILRNPQEQIMGIVEEKDASPDIRNIQEIYTGICVAKASHLNTWLPKLSAHNAQGEYYLTEIVGLALQEHLNIQSVCVQKNFEIMGVNNRLQLQELERHYQYQQAHHLMAQGVEIADASRIDIRGHITCGKDVFIDINAVLIGTIHLADGVHIGPNCVLKDVNIGENTEILSFSDLDGAEIGPHCHIGPYARIRPGTQLADNVKIGNFVEIKKSTLGEHSKAPHLSYIGDATIGNKVNIGAGTITCNYDGANKYPTVIEDGAFIGSDTQLVAPVTIGKNATIGAGSTIRKDVPAEGLTLTEAVNKTIASWKRPQKA